MAMAAIPEQLRNPAFRFCLIRGKDKRPFEPGWQKEGHAFDDPKLVGHNGNYGVVCGFGGLVVLDVDEPERIKALIDHQALPSTFTVRTGGGGYHFYFISPDVKEKIVLKDENGDHLGELQSWGAQVVGAGSIHPNDNVYEIINDVPIAAIEGTDLLAVLDSVIPKKSARDKLVQLEKEARRRRAAKDRDDAARLEKYAAAALEDEVAAVRSAGEGSRNSQLNESAFALFGLVKAGVLDESEVRGELERAASSAGLPDDEIERTIESAWGAATERDLPDDDRPREVDRPEPEAVTEELKDLASLILREGRPMDLIVDSCDRFSLGARDATRKLICCEMVQMVPSSRGLHPKLSGESGTGKTLAVKAFFHHLPSDAYIAGGLTPKALAYHKLGDRLFILLDDYVPNEDLDTIIKQTSSNFHQPYLHRTVKRQEAATLRIGKEQTWCVTSVDASQDIQVLNRQIPLNTDDSVELTLMVNNCTISTYGDGLPELYEDETVLLCREMFRQLRALDEIKVRVPFADRIEWLDTSNRRNPSIFMDILIGITALHCFQRETDEDGYYLATVADFECAKSLFTDNVDVQELINRLTKKERQFAELLVAHPEGLTRQEVSEKLKVSPARVSQIARGEKDGGLMQKLPGFDIVPVTRRLSDYESRTYQVYLLTTYDRLAGFDAVVRLNPNRKDRVRPEPNSKNDSKGVTTYSSKYSKYTLRKDLTEPLSGGVSLSLSFSQKKPYSPNSDSSRGLTDSLPPENPANKPNSSAQLVDLARRHGGRVSLEDCTRAGIDRDKALFLLGMLEAQYGWEKKELVSGLMVWVPPS